MSLFRPFVVSVSIAVVAGCADQGPTGPIAHLPRNLTASETNLVAANNEFAFRLFREVAREQSPDSNLFISPLSVSMALGMTYNGAAGTTAQAMDTTLGFGGMTLDEINQSYRGVIGLLRGLDPRVDFTLANSIWYRQGVSFEPAFFDVTHTYFDAQVAGLDFSAPSAPQTINDWVNAQTHGKIPEIVASPIPDNMVMYLINAVYFKGDWVVQFDKSRTTSAPFTLVDGSTASVPTMSFADLAPVQVGYVGGVQLLDLRYGGGAYSMTIAMPENPAAMDTLVSGLTRQRWDAWVAAFESVARQVAMPKFTLTHGLRMNDVLSALGMGVAFIPCDGRAPDCADLTRMRSVRDLYISEVLHKTYVDVNEEGTEAAGGTEVGIALLSNSSPWFVVDRPFLFAIRERFSGTILFLGRIMNPAAT